MGLASETEEGGVEMEARELMAEAGCSRLVFRLRPTRPRCWPPLELVPLLPSLSRESRAPWVLLCLCMLPLVVKVCPQRSHEKGRSPEWTSMCLSNELKEDNILPQRQQ